MPTSTKSIPVQYDASTVRALLAQQLTAIQVKADQDLLDQLTQDYLSWQKDFRVDSNTQYSLRVMVVQFLKVALEQRQELRQKQALAYKQFTQVLGRSHTDQDREQAMLRYCQHLGFSTQQLKGDQKAFTRWFDQQAVRERYLRRQAQLNRQLAFIGQRLGLLCVDELAVHPSPTELWYQLRIEESVIPLFMDTEHRVALAAFTALKQAVLQLPEALRAKLVSADAQQYLYRFAMEVSLNVWLQIEALTLVVAISPEHFFNIARQRFKAAMGADDFLVRARIVTLVMQHQAQHPHLLDLIDQMLNDPSAHVRQALVRLLVTLDDDRLSRFLPQLALQDSEAVVRAECFLAFEQQLTTPVRLKLAVKLLVQCFEQESQPYVLKVALRQVAQLPLGFHQQQPSFISYWLQKLTPAIEQLRQQQPNIAIKRWAAQMQERLWLMAEPKRFACYQALQAEVSQLKPNKRFRLQRAYLTEQGEAVFCRILAVIAQDNFGFQVEVLPWGLYISRGHRFGLRFWRVWHELRHSGTDKREAFRHTIGRIFHGTLRIPSAILAEQSETRVPGEPRMLDSEQGWRPYLPLVDELISALDEGYPVQPIRLYTAEGITEVQAPRNPLKRLVARFQLNFRFAQLNELRNWLETDNHNPALYLRRVHQMGFSIYFHPHQDEYCETGQRQIEAKVARFFPDTGSGQTQPNRFLAPAALPFSFEQLTGQLQDYFFSLYDNTIFHLSLFIAGISVVFYGNHWRQVRQLRRARAQIPLVIGGWGTRGKSGTERLKAAVSNALGYGLVSKTTGCEAMFLYAYDFGPLHELFLFRPYDKATIWEQKQVVEIAKDLGSKVFLWECMALTPEYVRILQQQWMQDDYLTLTNTFPDHEDLQGPAGINIPQVMTEFIPKNSRLFTTEEVMRPILQQSAYEKQTQFTGVGWLEAGQIAPDLLNRFPYAEHPLNIALVASTFKDLGVEQDFAIHAMADNVVPDIGVLSVSPTAALQGRQFEFINGMSANERLGCLSNWQRMGMAEQTLARNPDLWLMTVVNNREDRIARSKVFADILVNDISADCHLLIGNNLDGLLNYIHDAWRASMSDLQIWSEEDPSDKANDLALQRFIRLVRQQRVPVSEQELNARLEQICLRRDWVTGEAQAALIQPQVQQQQQRLKENFETYQSLRTQLLSAKPEHWRTYTEQIQTQLETWFFARIHVVHDYYASGEAVIHQICQHTPPGLKARVMGIQNIKGTGLNLVYRVQAWTQIEHGLRMLSSDTPSQFEQGLQVLSGIQDYGQLSELAVSASLEQASSKPFAQHERIQAELRYLENKQRQAMQAWESSRSQQSDTTTAPKSGLSRMGLQLLTGLEAFLDAGDAIKRRKISLQVYQDLTNERISIERAAFEIRQLNSRQKGGWLLQQVRKWIG